MIAQINTIPDKDEQQTLINEAKLEKAQGLHERSKQIDKALPISIRQVNKNGMPIQQAQCHSARWTWVQFIKRWV